jgi:hypothetical protein
VASGNFSQVGTGQYSGLPDQYYGAPHGAAQSFVANVTGVVSRIAFSLNEPYSSVGGSPAAYHRGVHWALRANSNGAPGAVLESGDVQPPMNNFTNTVNVTTGGITLNQGTRYWLALTPTYYYPWSAIWWTWRRSPWGTNTLPNDPSGDLIDYTFTGTNYTYLGTKDTDLDFLVTVEDPACIANQQAQSPVTVTPDGTGKVTITWDQPAGAQGYDFELYPTGTSCSDPKAYCPFWGASGNTVGIQGLPASQGSYTFTPAAGSYTFRVRPVRYACVSVISSLIYGNWTPPVTFLVKSGISGTNYLDLNASATYDLATGKCVAGGGEVPQDLSAVGGSISATNSNGTFPGTITGTTYNIPNVTQTAGTSITLSLDPTQWSCVCPVGCTYSGVTPGFSSAGYSFFVTGTKPPWYQTKNGLLYAGQTSGTAIKSDIPLTCSAATGCTPYLTTKNTDGTANTSGIPITGGGSIGTAFTNLSEDQRADSAVGSSSTGPLEDYDYFYTQLYSMGSNPATDFTGAKPGAAPANQKAYYAAGDVSTSGTWTVNSGESYVIFVNGNLTVTAPITVAQGGFLAFIVKGNIVVQNTVGQVAPTSIISVMDGLYYANGTLTIQGGKVGGDLKFIGEGSFVARQGIQLQRAYASLATNQTKPTELFTFRPDLIVNMPARMLKPQMLWQEVN